jgi:predicted lipid-binding transport protein (Tim44 family)
MLGQYDPEQDRRRREKTTVIMDLMKQKYDPRPNEKVIHPEIISASEIGLPDNIRVVITQIKAQDQEFDMDQFISRAQKAYIMYVNAISENDLETLKNLVDQDLLTKLPMQSSMKTKVNSIQNAVLSNAVLFGDRAMLTVDFTYDIIAFSEDSNGNILSGSRDKVQNRKSQVTFSQYLMQEKGWKIIKETR